MSKLCSSKTRSTFQKAFKSLIVYNLALFVCKPFSFLISNFSARKLIWNSAKVALKKLSNRFPPEFPVRELIERLLLVVCSCAENRWIFNSPPNLLLNDRALLEDQIRKLLVCEFAAVRCNTRRTNYSLFRAHKRILTFNINFWFIKNTLLKSRPYRALTPMVLDAIKYFCNVLTIVNNVILTLGYIKNQLFFI